MHRKIILFELNEVPWRIVDDHAANSPDGVMASILRRSRQYVAVAADSGHLSPWRTWPSLHRGVPDHVHLISDLGQDRDAVDEAYPPVWRLLHDHGASVGVCCSLHSHPPPDDMDSYAFYLPDAFAADDRAHPRALSRFQAFNLSMSRLSARNVDTSISWSQAVRMLASAPALGFLPKTYGAIAAQLAAERRQPHRRSRRRTLQSVLAFDVFMTQLKRTTPDFSTFFTNHVASAMHRYWAAAYPADYARPRPGQRLAGELSRRDSVGHARNRAHARSPRRVRGRPPRVRSLDRVKHGTGRYFGQESRNCGLPSGPGDFHATSRDARRLLAATARDASANQRHGE